MALSFFSFDDVEIYILVPLPIEISEGLLLDGSSLSIEKESENLNVKVGIGGEVHISESLNPVHTLTLKYLPDATGAKILSAFGQVGLPFGLQIRIGYPKYSGIASYCYLKKKPALEVEREGVNDQVFEIIMTDYND